MFRRTTCWAQWWEPLQLRGVQFVRGWNNLIHFDALQDPASFSCSNMRLHDDSHYLKRYRNNGCKSVLFLAFHNTMSCLPWQDTPRVVRSFTQCPTSHAPHATLCVVCRICNISLSTDQHCLQYEKILGRCWFTRLLRINGNPIWIVHVDIPRCKHAVSPFTVGRLLCCMYIA
jgi:hypothetical protein